MKIKIDVANAAALAATLLAANGRAAQHTYTTAGELIALAARSEKTLAQWLAKGERSGAKVFSVSGSELPTSYKYSPIRTRVTIERGSAAWYLTAVTASDRINLVQDRVALTAAQDAAAVARMRSGYAVQS